MMKSPQKLTAIQGKALEFIRTSLERTGTAPTLRELCAYMGYSAIGSAQDLVAALRRKGFLQTPKKQAARSLILTHKAVALNEPAHQSTADTYVVHCLNAPLTADSQDEERLGTLRMSVNMFNRPFPDPCNLYALQMPDNSMLEAGMIQGDWLVINRQSEANAGDIVVSVEGDAYHIARLMKDRQGWFLKPENGSEIKRFAEDEAPLVAGRVLAVQRVFPESLSA